jgi:hypothetical protein
MNFMADGATNPQHIPAMRMASIIPRRTEPISHERAREAAMRLIHSHFGTEPHAVICIPATADDDDVVILDYIQQQIEKQAGAK